jgi:hypothetical protein
MKTIFISVISIFLTFAAVAQNSVTLKYNLGKNKVYRFKTITDQGVTVTVQGMANETKVNSSSVTSLKIVDSKPEFIVAEVRFDTISVNTSTMGKNITMSSASEGNFKSTDMKDVMAYFMNQMSKNPLFVKIDYSGKVLEIINLKVFSGIILKNIDSLKIDGPMGAMMPGQIKNMVEEKTLKTQIEAITNYLPGKNVSVGDKWDVTNSMTANGMAFTINNSFKLEKVNNNIATLSAEANVLPASSEPVVMMGAKINYSDIKGLNKATITIDSKTGLLIESNGKTSMSGNMSLDAGGQMMQIPMDVKGDTKIISLQ